MDRYYEPQIILDNMYTNSNIDQNETYAEKLYYKIIQTQRELQEEIRKNMYKLHSTECDMSWFNNRAECRMPWFKDEFFC